MFKKLSSKSTDNTNFHSVAWALIFGTFISRAGFFMSIPFLGIYLHEMKGYDHATTGAILAVSFFVSTFSSFFGGAWSDRIGRYPVLILSMFIWSCVFIGFAVAQDIWHFFILNALSGLCRSIFEPTARALLADVTPQEKRIDVFNARYFAINLGGAIGPLVGLSLDSSETPKTFFLTAVIYFIYGIVIYIWKLRFPESNNVSQSSEIVTLKKTISVVRKDRVFRYFLIGNIFVSGAYAHLDTTLSQYLGNEKVTIYSTLFITNAISILILQYPIIKIMKKHSPLSSLKLGSFLFAVGILGFGFSSSTMLLIFSVILFTAGEILCFIVGDVLISDIAPKNLRGAYFGASGLQFIGQSAGAWVGGILLGILGIGNGEIVFGLLALLTIMAYPFFKYGEKLLQENISKNIKNIKIVS
jgi:MFS family permease